MTLREMLLKESSFMLDEGVIRQAGWNGNHRFEHNYLALREKEGRLYPDEMVKQLPYIGNSHPLKKEWSSRLTSLRWLLAYLKNKNKHHALLEVGCGNGWLSSNLALALEAEVCAMDVNEVELLQGARVFGLQDRLHFVYGDVFTANLPEKYFSIIILASSAQYFPDLKKLIGCLLSKLTSQGELHILDTPFYDSGAAAAASERSFNHFCSLGLAEMNKRYFHHTLDALADFKMTILFHPRWLSARILRRLFRRSQPAFPWVAIRPH